ncbi:MAG: G-D-S-L family lipolytic protein, partial [Bacteroidetes bacterium]|nr:G-D-S-L family lipolytic protein [Bacteroidota bacterium]
MKIRSLLYIMVGVAMAACKPEIDEFSPNQGSADFTKYIALGNTYVAGYADGDVGMTSQNYAFPNILAGQFKLVGG